MDDVAVMRYNEHAKFSAEIAEYLLNGNVNGLKEDNWIKELIAFYLLIPYITNELLDTPDERCKIPKIDSDLIIAKTDTWKEISINNLRNAICHWLVFIDSDNEWNKVLVFDDRVFYERREHDNLTDKEGCCHIKVNDAHTKLMELIKWILNQ